MRSLVSCQDVPLAAFGKLARVQPVMLDRSRSTPAATWRRTHIQVHIGAAWQGGQAQVVERNRPLLVHRLSLIVWKRVGGSPPMYL